MSYGGLAMVARTPDPLDVMVGARIRIFRTHCGMSQSDLADKIGVAFQQVQKYEKGTNRVGASRLSRIAAVLGVSIGELFESSGDKPADSKSPFRLLAGRDALRVLTAFSRMSDPRVRRAIAQLVETVADQQPTVISSIAPPAAAARRDRRRKTSGT
jgi:transcriptional regulator with XRE-family HTH domain